MSVCEDGMCGARRYANIRRGSGFPVLQHKRAYPNRTARIPTSVTKKPDKTGWGEFETTKRNRKTRVSSAQEV